jgi:hypothetical protein
VEKDEPVQAKEANELCQEVVLSQHTLCVVGINRGKVLTRDVLLGESLLNVVFLEYSILYEV